MRFATPLKPRIQQKRSASVVKQWLKVRKEWMTKLEPASHFHKLFDHIPGIYFFAKNKDGHIMFASEGLRLRYSMSDETDIIGMTDFDLNPGSMAQAYVDDDDQILQGKSTLVERIELWWDRQGIPDWFLVTKLPLHDQRGRVQGVMGLLRRPHESEQQLPVFQTVAKAAEIMRRDYAKSLVVSEVAKSCGQSLRQLQRRFQSVFGITPQEFLLKTRVLAAAKMLESTTYSVAEIARRCGFVDHSSFTQHFRKRTNMTPATYRRSHGATRTGD
jgi:AraC-like DNA-binding protein